MRLLGFYWGIFGVIVLLLFAVIRLSARVLELNEYSLNELHWLVLIIFIPWMAWAEGYKGFHLAFSPRTVARAKYLRENHRPVIALLAPFYCMGYIHATRKRKLISWLMALAILLFVILLRITPQPWRGIIDAGVVVGLSLGIFSLLYFWANVEAGKWNHPIALDLPEEIKADE